MSLTATKLLELIEDVLGNEEEFLSDELIEHIVRAHISNRGDKKVYIKHHSRERKNSKPEKPAWKSHTHNPKEWKKNTTIKHAKKYLKKLHAKRKITK